MDEQKKIGIITMHKVLNAGSSLQAWALYHKIEQLGYSCEIIDYQYPNHFHCSHQRSVNIRHNVIRDWINRGKYFLLYRTKKQHKRFSKFWQSSWQSSAPYNSPESLQQNPPKYDIYIVGSDQVWNPKCMYGDPSFFCAFANDKPRISYASSFAQADIPNELYKTYETLLSGFSSISVREEGARDLVRKLTGKDATVVCDPTLLLTKQDYAPFIAKSEIKIKKPYILAYILSYAYNPYPTILEVIEKVSRERKLPVIYMMANTIDDYHFGHSITNAGPNEFLSLIANAECVVTSSFHGVAFALNFEKDFYTVLPKNVNKNNRIYSLLQTVGVLNRVVYKDSHFSMSSTKLDYKSINIKIKEFREESTKYLECTLSSL
ncbi:MAG: polysaccharide pyruvyl transferase family protein [Bacteroidaceae bacterium]|nr:polysaccharide pyruvyl transferase family protein [Bacteroidaceae bacterium]